ncbi:MAG: hypothetical protein Q7K29_09295 [Thermoleophilia bacterium]|nr:hypothetical protein [Thermoleophilia bacterium]
MTEIPVAQGPGDQVSPAVEGGTAVYNDLERSAAGWVVSKDIFGEDAAPIGSAGVIAGPDIDSGAVAWQNLNNQVCRRPLAGGADKCVTVSAASSLSLSGNKAITSHNSSSTIRLVNFDTSSSKMLDSYNFPGYRYGPDIDGDKTVWIRERGYAGQYYEPVLFTFDIKSSLTEYWTRLGGGVNATGASRFARQHTSISGNRIMYQQKENASDQSWDIFEAITETFGYTVVGEPGDQTNPSLSGNLVVYQDNRSGHPDESGVWTGEWNIYMKDLASGIEQPVCTAPGDQKNPVIKGNMVVWQDNRNGDWDVYAAVLSPAAEDSRLMDLYSPSLVLHHNEDFAPEEAGVMLAAPGSALLEDGIERLRAPGDLSLDSLGDFGANAFIDLPGKCVICGPHLPDPSFDRVIRAQYQHPYAAVMAGGGYEEAVYGRVVRLGGRTVIQYWINYYFNNHPLLSHEGDWELIEVELDGDGQPGRVSASQHGYGKMRHWRDVEIRDGHPVIYVGRGSHANYFEPGSHTVEASGLPMPMFIDEADAYEDGRVTNPRVLPLSGSDLDLPGQRWLRFRGRWGEVNDTPGADPPAGPVWSGDRWQRPFSWQGLDWDGLSGIRGRLVGIEIRMNGSVTATLSGMAGSVGETLSGTIENSLPGSSYLSFPEIGQKVIIAGSAESHASRLEITAAAPAVTPLRVVFSDPLKGLTTNLDYNNIAVGPGAMATLSLGPDAERAGYLLEIDSDGDGQADSSIAPEVVVVDSLDVVAPQAVTDLTVLRQEDGSIRLEWTAPGDDSDEGTAAMYSIRYSRQPICEQNWVSAEPIAVLAPPLEAGLRESVITSDIPPDEVVYFAIKATDDSGNESAISTMLPGQQPRLTLSIASVFWGSYADYLSGDLSVRFRLTNDGDGTASEVAISQVNAYPAAVIPGPAPPPVALIEVGQYAEMDIRFFCPPGTTRFTIRLYAGCRDDSGNELWFPGPAPGTA